MRRFGDENNGLMAKYSKPNNYKLAIKRADHLLIKSFSDPN